MSEEPPGRPVADLQQGATRFELLTRALTDAIWDLDLTSGAIEWSFGMGHQFGYPAEEAGDLDWWKRNLHPDDADRVIAGIDLAIEHDEHWRDEYLFRHQDGSWRWVLDRGVVVREAAEEGGRPLRMVGAMTDITEQKRLETRLQLADRMATIGTLAAGVAHEINNPLAYLLGNLELLRERLDVPDGTVVTDLASLRLALDDAIGGAARIATIVRDMKAFSRPEGSEVERVDVREVLASAIAMTQNEIRHRGRLVLDLEAVAPIQGSASRLAQVFLNLLVNAAQALPEGTVHVNVVRVACRTVDQRVVVEISDTGEGVRPEDLPHLFVPFYSTRQARGATGLGLSICHGIVSGLGGEITVESERGRGSTFRVVLPCAPEPSEAVTSGVKPARADPAGMLDVLVIDDEPGILELVRQVLDRHHRVVTTDKAREALAWISGGRRFDVILCDLMMPEMTGMDFYATLLVGWPEQAARVGWLTGGAFTAHARDFLADVPSHRLEKPFRNARLRELVREIAGG